MSGANRPARLNRTLLGLLGLVLLGAGVFAVAAHRGMLPFVDRAAPLTPGPRLPPTWVLVLAVAAAVAFGLLCLRWLLAQLARRPRSVTLTIAGEQTPGSTELPGSAVVGPFVEEVSACPGVADAHATLTGSPERPRLSVVISSEGDADLTDIRGFLDTSALPRLRQALDLEVLPADVEFRFPARQPARMVH